MNDEFTRKLREKLSVGEDIDFESYADRETRTKIKPASQYERDVWNAMHTPTLEKGVLFPWEKTHGFWLLRDGELAVWTGKRGEGKSYVLTQLAQSVLQQGKKVLIASMEMPLTDTMERMQSIALGTQSPTRQYHREYYSWLDDKLWLYDQSDDVPAKTIVGLCRYAIEELGIDHIILDSLMMIRFEVRSSFEKLEKQASFVRRLASLAKETNKCIHLVAHMRKGDGRTPQGSDDVKGGGDITDLASTVWIIESNKRKQEEHGKKEPDLDILAEPDLWIKNDKNRRGITGHKCAFYRHQESGQILARASNRPMEMVLPFLQRKSFTSDSAEEAEVSF